MNNPVQIDSKAANAAEADFIIAAAIRYEDGQQRTFGHGHYSSGKEPG